VCCQAVNISCFWDSRFHMLDSVWESESFVGLRNFTLMADIYFEVPGNYTPAIDSINRSKPLIG
jgi:hypothetical protein